MNSEKNLKGKKPRKGLFYNFCYDFVKVTGALPTLLWLRPRIYRPYGTKTPKGGALLSANHRSLIDPVIMHTVFPGRRMHSLATKNLFDTKLKSFFFNQMHCIMVDKENFSLSSFHDVVARLEEGKLVVIFPEGGLNRDKEDTLLAFKSGAVLMAHKAKTPIIPVYIVKREKWYHRQRIIVGEPFDVREAVGAMPTLDALNKASEMLRQKELELREYYEALPVAKRLHRMQDANECAEANDNAEIKEEELKNESKI